MRMRRIQAGRPRPRKHWVFAVLIVLGTPPAQAGGFDIDWWTIDGGGTIDSQSGEWELQGSVGQWDASAQSLSSGTWTLDGGFWGFEPVERTDGLFSDRFEAAAPFLPERTEAESSTR